VGTWMRRGAGDMPAWMTGAVDARRVGPPKTAVRPSVSAAWGFFLVCSADQGAEDFAVASGCEGVYV
jgi:hypothetical protein